MTAPLTKDQLWSAFIDRNNHWITDGAKFTPEGLRKFFDSVWRYGHDAGHELGIENGKALSERERESLRKVRDAAKRASGLNDDMFDLARFLKP